MGEVLAWGNVHQMTLVQTPCSDMGVPYVPGWGRAGSRLCKPSMLAVPPAHPPAVYEGVKQSMAKANQMDAARSLTPVDTECPDRRYIRPEIQGAQQHSHCG